MTDQDHLAEIKDTLRYWDEMHGPYGPAPRPPAVAAQEAARHVNRAQIDWLVGEKERLRGLLRRLEWAGDKHGDLSCPACDAFRAPGEKDPHPGWGEHAPDCWLAAEL